MKKFLVPISVTALALVAMLSTGWAATPKIGVASAVKNSVQRVTGGGAQQIAVGNDLFSSERIRTGEDSAAQIMLLDKTTLTLGSRSELTLDRFVYDPSKSRGRVVVNAVQGAFRFISGSQNPQSYTIRTPAGSLGVRGTIFDLFAGNGFVILALGQGGVAFTFDFNGKQYTLDKPFTAYIFLANGTVLGPGYWDFFGINFVGGPQNNGLDFYINNIDQLNAIIEHGKPAPVITPPYGNFNHGG